MPTNPDLLLPVPTREEIKQWSAVQRVTRGLDDANEGSDYHLTEWAKNQSENLSNLGVPIQQILGIFH